MLLQADTPPAAVAPAAVQAPTLQRLAPIAQKPRPLTLPNKAGRTESAVVRHQIFLRTTVRSGPALAPIEGVTVAAIPCVWTVESFLQREICFYSMTGLMACADTNTIPLMAVENGQADLQAGTTCEVFAKPVVAAEDRVIAALDRTKDTLFAEDYALVIKPQLLRGGVTITER